MAEPVKCGCRQDSEPHDLPNDEDCLYPAAAAKAARLDKGVAEIRTKHYNILNPPPYMSVSQAGKDVAEGLEFALRALGEEP
jgi:hypothetical protein